MAITQTQSITNPGPNAMKVTGGTLTAPAILLSGQSGSFTYSDSTPLQLDLLPPGSPDLGGGHGEE